MTDLVKYFLFKHEDLRLGPQHRHKKLIVKAYICNPSGGEVEIGESASQSRFLQSPGIFEQFGLGITASRFHALAPIAWTVKPSPGN